MAKKLNKKVAIAGIVLLGLIIGVGVSGFVYLKIRRDPDRALKLYRKALEKGDYVEAENQLGRAYVFGKTDTDKIQRLFELADFHLIQNGQHAAEWNKAMGCWSKIVTIDTKNVEARKALLDFYYQAADAGYAQAWRNVEENTTELIETLQSKGIEPDVELLTAHAKALLSIARRGETTNRRELLGQSIEVLTQLIDKEPQNAEFYQLMAEAATVEGELNAQDGVLNAVEDAQDKAITFLETSVDNSDDKATSIANLMLYKLQMIPFNDPNGLEAFRVELDERSKDVTPNDKLWVVKSMAYETPGKVGVEAELNQAIEAVGRARELDPENFQYVLRMSRLLYRKGNAFQDTAALADALQIAEEALTMDEVQDVPGPLQSRNLSYRFFLNNYLADLYLQRALADQSEDKTAEKEQYIQKAKPRIDEIINTLGTTDNPAAQKYQGLLALVEGQRDQGIRLLYRAYEQRRALDSPGQLSNVDGLVCVVLAEEAKRENQIGLRAEFLQTARLSRDRYVLQQPQLHLDYAEVLNDLRNFRGWAIIVEQLVLSFQNRYSANEKSRRLLIEATTASGQFDKAREYIDAFQGPATTKLQFEFNLLVRQIAQLKQTIAGLEAEKEPPDDQVRELQALRQERNSHLTTLLQSDSENLNIGAFATACQDLIENGQASSAAEYLDMYLADHPDVLSLRFLRLQTEQDDPLDLSPDQLAELYLQAIESLEDPQRKALLLSKQYRLQKDYDKALEILEQTLQLVADEDPDIVLAKFDIDLERNDIPAAEKLFQVIRSGNLDRCEGNLAGARLEILKKNYEQALRRLDEALAQRPLMSYGYLLKSQVQRELNDEEGAIESAKTAIRMNSKNPDYARNLASLLFSRNVSLGNKVTIQQQTEAEQAILLASRLNPGDTRLQSVYAESIQEQDPDRALSIRQRLLEDVPTGMNALMLGNMAMRMARTEWDAAKKTGLVELAGKAYQQGLGIEPGNQALRQAYADYLRFTKQEEKALDLLKDDQNLLWKFYMRNGQYEQAQTILNELLTENPDDTLLIQGLIVTLQAVGERKQVGEYLNRLAELDKTKETELWILQKYIDNGFAEEADQRLSSFRDRYPDEAAVDLIEAWTKMGKGQLNDALALTNHYLESDTNNPGAWRLRGRLYRLMNQPRKSVEDLQRSKNIKDTPEVRIELATVYLQLNQVTAAIGELVPSLDDPQAPMRILLMLESLYKENDRASDLDKFYTTMIERNSESPYWYLRSSSYYIGIKDYSKAQELLEKAMELGQQGGQPNPSALDYYLECLYQSQQYDKTIMVGSRYIDGPIAYIAYSHIGEVHARMNQRQKAIENFSKALDKCGTNETLLEGIMRAMLGSVGEEAVTRWIDEKLTSDSTALPGHILAFRLEQMKGSYNKAIEHLDKCIEIIGKDNLNYLIYAFNKVNMLIMSYVKTSDQQYLDRAIALNGQLLELQPDNSSLLNNMAYLLIDNDQQLETALEYSRKAHQSEPGNPVYLDTYAYAQCKIGRYEEGKENLLWAMQIYEAGNQPVPWDLYKHLAIAYEGLGEVEQAIETYQKALDASEQITEKEKLEMQQAITRLQQL